MNRSEFRRKIMAMHQDEPQRAAHVDMALGGLFTCLDELAKYGHALEVKPADFMFGGEEFPKMMWHPQVAPQGKIFHTQESLPTEPGWSDKPSGEQPQEEQQEQSQAAIDEPDDPHEAQTYPKKLYHPDVPGGLDVQNAEMEDEFKSRGYTEEKPDRGDVNFGSATQRFEGRDGGEPERGQLGKQTPQATRPPVPAKPNGKK